MRIIFLAFIILCNNNMFSQDLIRSHSGHNDFVFSVSISPDGKILASGSIDKTIKLWDVSNGSLIHTLSSYYAILSVSFSPDGKILASGSRDGTIKLWNVSDGSLIRTLSRNNDVVTSVSFNSDGNIIASGSSDKTIKLWDVSDGSLIRTLSGHNDKVRSVSFSPDGQILASGSSDKTIKLWDVSDGSLIRTLSGHRNYVLSVSFSPVGRILATGSWDETIKLWNVSDGSLIRTLTGHRDFIYSVSFSPDGQILASGSFDKTIKLWNVSDASLIRTLSVDNYVHAVSFSSDGKILASGGSDKMVNLWDVTFLKIESSLGSDSGIISSLPPILSIQDIEINKNIINAGETAKLVITVKNVGPGDAQNVYAEISSNTLGLNFPQKTNFNQIKKEGGIESINVYVNGGLDLPSGEASLDIKIIEPDFKVKIQGKRLTFATREFKKPELIIAKYSILEGTSASPNNQIDINEIIDLMFAVQNIGEGDAENIKIEVNNSQQGVMFLGCGEGSSISKNLPEFIKISPGKFETVNFRYFLNSDLIDKELRFNIKINEKYNKYGISENKNIAINTEQKDEGYIRRVEVTKSEEDKKVIIEDIPDFEIDIRKDIPMLSKSNPDAVAVIIGNKNYRKKDIPSVDFALEDASIMKQYLINTLGYREGNIIYFSNAAQGDMNSVFGTSSNYKGKLYNYVKEGKSDVFIYYSGHGAPDPESKQGYFVPVDCDPSTVSLNGYSLNTFYNNLSKINYKSLTLVIDACFSGSSEKGPLLKNISPVFITVDNQVIAKENTIIFTSSKGDQVSSWYPEKKHSLFTYYFLKGIQGYADINSDKKLTYKELSDYLLENVTYMARRLNSREQIPQVIGDKSKVLIEY